MPEDRSDFAREMERRRVDLGLSQKRAAVIAGVSPQRWSQVELGYESRNRGRVKIPAPPSRQFVIKAAGALSWDRAEALQTAGHSPEPEPRDRIVDEPPTSLWENWRRLSRQQRRALEWMVRLMVDKDAPAPDDTHSTADPRPVFAPPTESTNPSRART